MSKATRPWTVTPHHPIEKLDDNLWVISSAVPGLPFRRRMAIAKRSDGTLLFYHAVPMDDAALEEIRAWGEPKYLVIAHDQHGIDATPFKEKLGLKLYGPKACAEKMRARFEMDGTIDEIPADPDVTVESVVGTKSGEPVVTVRSGDGARVSLVFSDVLQNAPAEETKFLLRLLGFSGPRPKLTPVFKMFFVGDKKSLKADLEKWSAIPNLARLVPCHGRICEDDAAGALRDMAARL